MIGHMYRYLNEKKMAHWYFLRTPRGGSSLYLVRSLLVQSASLSTLWFRSKLSKMTENDENFKKGRGWQKFPRWKFFKFSKEFNGIFSFIIDPFIFEKKWCQWGGVTYQLSVYQLGSINDTVNDSSSIFHLSFIWPSTHRWKSIGSEFRIDLRILKQAQKLSLFQDPIQHFFFVGSRIATHRNSSVGAHSRTKDCVGSQLS